MRVTIIGTGYVGLVSGACLADLGHTVIGLDTDETKLEKLRQGIMPIFEPGLEEMVKRNMANGRLRFTSSYEEAIPGAEVISLAVGTPSREDGSVDMRFVLAAMESVGKHLSGYAVIADKSTVPVGTAEEASAIISRFYHGEFDVISNPEFLREGHAVSDFMHPPRIVIGSHSPRAAEVMGRLYAFIDCEKIVMSVRSAELTKYAANAFLATKISYINEMAHLAEHLDADIEEVAKGIGTDPRIGKDFLRAGLGWGGSCFPKDVRALHHVAEGMHCPTPVISGAMQMNGRTRERVVERLTEVLGDLTEKKIAVLGIAFKNNTDDTRESPALDIIKLFHARGASVVAFDPKAEVRTADQSFFVRVADAYETMRGADALVLATEWDEFRALDLDRAKQLMRGRVIFDARNLLHKSAVEKMGFYYFRIGAKEKSLTVFA